MIGFSELRKRSAEWQVDIAVVERVYVMDWMIKGIFDHPDLSRALVLRGGAALRYAHCADYPIAPDPEFFALESLGENLQDIVKDALRASADSSGMNFALADFERTGGKVEYTGPLGRRSAAQPRVSLSILPGRIRLAPARTPLIHPFDDDCMAIVSAVALDEIAAEGIATLAQKPRARDVFDVWFVLTHATAQLKTDRVREVLRDIAIVRADSPFDPAHRAPLARAWEGAMRGVRGRPSFDQVEKDLTETLKFILPG